ncbi:MAG: hypothetical protein PF569_03515 [Candidatus Woesearchaeota archaeon]|jgi:hypothetical protein|nr:hypothetical protein [Candidatus Woesearchaeota archaeon]
MKLNNIKFIFLLTLLLFGNISVFALDNEEEVTNDDIIQLVKNYGIDMTYEEIVENVQSYYKVQDLSNVEIKWMIQNIFLTNNEFGVENNNLLNVQSQLSIQSQSVPQTVEKTIYVEKDSYTLELLIFITLALTVINSIALVYVLKNKK